MAKVKRKNETYAIIIVFLITIYFIKSKTHEILIDTVVSWIGIVLIVSLMIIIIREIERYQEKLQDISYLEGLTGGVTENLYKSYDFLDSNITKNFYRIRKIERELRKAIENNEFYLCYQPKINIFTDRIVGAEALLRWNNKELGMISPEEFIPIAEKNALIKLIDIYVLERVCMHIKEWIDKSIEAIPISVNLSKVHLESNTLLDRIQIITRKYNIPTELIEFEITEGIYTGNINKIVVLIDKLREAGFRISIDDFGKGDSSLGLLKNISFDVLKIDRSFFIEQNDIERAQKIIKKVIDLAHELGMDIVAEGIEMKEQVDFLKEVDCSVVQGFYFARPMQWKDFNIFLNNINMKS